MDTFSTQLCCEDMSPEFWGVYERVAPTERRMHEECGVTQLSLANAITLIRHRGKPVKVVITYQRDPWDYLVIATFRDGHTHTFKGFSWGYGGEGVRGLETFMAMCGHREINMSILGPMDTDVQDHVLFQS